MEVRVHLYGTLRRFSQPGTPGFWVGNLPEGSTILHVIEQIGAEPREVAAAAINDRHCPLDTPIPPEAEVLLVTHIGGG